MSAPFATIKAYRRKGGAVITVERHGLPPRRHHVSLRRYHAVREWLALSGHPWVTSGAYASSSIAISLWATQRRTPNDAPTSGQSPTGGDRTPTP